MSQTLCSRYSSCMHKTLLLCLLPASLLLIISCGSGGDDGYLALRASGENLAGVPLSWHTQLGYLRAGSSDVLGDTQQRNLWFAGASLDWAIAQPVSLLLQLDAHAAPMTSAISALGNDAFMLALGVRWRFVDQWSLDVSLIEDISVATTADITFQATDPSSVSTPYTSWRMSGQNPCKVSSVISARSKPFAMPCATAFPTTSWASRNGRPRPTR